MRIQHNIMAMNAYRNYNNNTSALSKNLERLSSGYKINRAGDDAAGLAISEKMRAQITGLTAAQKNVKDGISLVNTAEGAMQEIQDMLNRMVSLATQSANGTYDNDVDRANLQKEVESLKAEINRIADSANFNGIKLLDGSLDVKTHDVITMTGGETVATGADLILQDPAKPTEGVGTGTITKHTPLGEGATEFELDLQNLCVQGAKEGDELKVTLGNQSIILKAKDSPTDTELGWDDTRSIYTVKTADLGDTKEIAKAVMGAFNGLRKTVPGGQKNGLTIDGEEFTATLNGDNKVKFTQNGTEKTVNPNLDVKIEYYPVGGGASAAVANVNVGDASTPASFNVDLTLPSSGTTDLEMFDQHFRITDGTSGQSLDGGIASHALPSAPTGSGTAASPYIITRDANTTDKDVMDFIAGKLSAVSVGDKTFSAAASADGKTLTFTATSPGVVKDSNGTELTSATFTAAINEKVTVSSSSSSQPTDPDDPVNPDDPDDPGNTPANNPLGTVTAEVGTAASAATASTATVDFSSKINAIDDTNATSGGTVQVGSTTYEWGSSPSASNTALTGGTTADIQADLRTKLASAAQTEAGSGWIATWGTGDDANTLTLTHSTTGATSPAASGTVLGETATTTSGADSVTAEAGSALAQLETDGLEGGTLTVAGKSFFFSKYNDASAAAGGDETVPSGATVLYLSDYGDASTLATSLNTALTGANAPTGFTAAVSETSGKVNIALTESSGNEGTNDAAALQAAISFTPKATSSSGGGGAAEGIEIVRMSLTAHEETTSGTPSSISGTANASIGVGSGTAAIAAVYEFTITESTPLETGNTITIGSDQYEVVADETTINDGEAKVHVGDVTGASNLATFIASKATDSDYTITASGSNLVYTANRAGSVGGSGTGPSSAPTVVSITTAQNTGSNNPSISAGTANNTTTGADAVNSGKTLSASTLDSGAIKTAADAVTGITSGAIKIEKNASDKLELKINDKVIGTSTETVDGSTTTFNFKASDGTTSLGSVTASGGAPAAADITAALETGFTYTAASTGTPGGGDDDGGDTTTGSDTALVASSKLAVAGIDLTDTDTALTEENLKDIKKAFESLGSNGKILVNQDVEVDLKGITDSLTEDSDTAGDLMQAIADRAKAAADAWNAANSATAGYKYTNIRVSTSAAGDPDSDIAAHDAGDGIYILMDQEAVSNGENGSKLIGTYNVNTTQNFQGAGKDNNVLASTIITEEKMKNVVADGNILTIGNKSYIFKTAGDDSVIKEGNGVKIDVEGKDGVKEDVKVIDVSDYEPGEQAKKAMEILASKGFAENDEFTIGFETEFGDGYRLSIHETEGALDNDDPMSEALKTIPGFNSLIKVESYYDVQTQEGAKYNENGKPLTLQIGDTSDSFNQLEVSIGDMHVSAMCYQKRDEDGNLIHDKDGNTINNDEPGNSIADINIGTQEGAKTAINIIKDAINYVSSVRGTLGAISNRLDHTANNLSVMAENITDAESTIRDTDIAEEMMAYTKNNILVQSAQAMLAQANQVPQGVLQLLQ